MSININENTEILFEEDIHLTNITEFGIKWNELTKDIVVPGPEGARFNLDFEGRVYGPDIKGTIKGTDYLEVRADGKFMLNIHAVIVTDDDKRISVQEDGILYPGKDGKAHIQLNLQFSTHHREYEWMNSIQGWALCEVDMVRGQVRVKVYRGQFTSVPEAV